MKANEKTHSSVKKENKRTRKVAKKTEKNDSGTVRNRVCVSGVQTDLGRTPPCSKAASTSLYRVKVGETISKGLFAK